MHEPSVREIFGSGESDSEDHDESDAEDHESDAWRSQPHEMFGSSDRLFVGDLDGDLAMLVGGDYEIIKLHPVSIFFMTNLLNAQYTTLKPSRDYCRCFKKLSKTVL